MCLHVFVNWTYANVYVYISYDCSISSGKRTLNIPHRCEIQYTYETHVQILTKLEHLIVLPKFFAISYRILLIEISKLRQTWNKNDKKLRTYLYLLWNAYVTYLNGLTVVFSVESRQTLTKHLISSRNAVWVYDTHKISNWKSFIGCNWF